MKHNKYKSDYRSLIFLKSAFTENNRFNSTIEVIEWLKERNKQVPVKINKTTFKDLKKWDFNDNTGAIIHETGKFFSIIGIHVKTNTGKIAEWEQPIINQPEIGYLGIITKEFDGILYFLMQAKIEPGNLNNIQLSPTLQATKSNYSQVHKGKRPLYLEYFQHAKKEQVLLDQLQSEQGARFLKKRNRNIIIKIDEEIELHKDFVWLTLGQIKKLMRADNLVNMDTRTVLSAIPFGNFEENVIDFFNFLENKNNEPNYQQEFLRSALTADKAINSIDEIIAFLTKLKCEYELEVSQVHLSKIKDWEFTDYEIKHINNKFFKVIPVEVEIGNREVISWHQPMIEPAQEGLCAFVCKDINGILHFAVQAKLECGNFDTVEFAPTVQCLTGNFRDAKQGTLPFLDYVLNAPVNRVVYDAMQSEEGGRFYKEQNRNLIVIAGDEIQVELPENFIWMTLNQLYHFMKFNNFLNIQARSLISAISFI